MYTDDELNQMRREFLMNRELDGETRSRIMFVAAALEQMACEQGDENAHQIYVATCWYFAQPGHLAELDEAHAEVFEYGMDALRDAGWDI
jgi:hypothetical protein